MMSDEIEVLDNFLPISYFNKIKEKILNQSHFPWYYQNDLTMSGNQSEKLNEIGFSHLIYFNNEIFSNELYLILSGFYGLLLDITNTKQVIKSRADMTLFNPNKVMHRPHIDLFFPHITSIFYLTDSDAETVIYTKKIVDYKNFDPLNENHLKNLEIKTSIQPKENRVIIFNGSYVHTGYSPFNHKHRVLINTNLIW
jgi:hypothetical protein